jgi:hypothetical protein
MSGDTTAGPQQMPRWVLMAFAALLLPLMLWMSPDYGVTWDELPRQAYGEKIWQFYQGLRARETFATDPAGGHLYGGLFDVTAVGLQRLLPLDPYLVRHALNAVAGWLGIVGGGLLATRLGGRTAGLLAMVLLATAPRYWGDAMNNPKDLPFAAAATAALAVLAGIPARYPWLPVGRAVTLGLAIGLALAIRPGGLLFLVYAGVVLAVQIARARAWTPRQLAATAAMFLLTTLVATTVPLPVWPWLQQHPYTGLLDALAGVAHFEWSGTMIFQGADVHSRRLPWTYVPVWLLYTTPLVLLAGVALALPALGRRTPGRAGAWGLLGAAAFPVAYVIARHSTLYDGIRHLLFIVPPLAALAALGWTALLGARRDALRWSAALALAVGLAEPVAFSLRNHPHQIVYFNPLLGGPRAAAGRFELDYWGNCLFPAQQHIAALARRAGIPVTVSGHRWRQMGANAGRLPQLTATRPEAGRHHVELVLHRGRRDQLRALAARGDTIARVEMADGTVICSALPGPAYAELQGRLQR